MDLRRTPAQTTMHTSSLGRVIVCGSESVFLSAQIALDAHGIRHTDYRELADGLHKFPRSITVDDADFDTAMAIVRDLQASSPYQGLWDPRGVRILAVLLAVATIVAFVTMIARYWS
jgi:hypothetical protein